MSHHVIEFDEKCKSCKGTGLYVGMAERDGAAVVCHTCEGTGCHHVRIEYDDFEGKVTRPDIQQVHEVNPGIVIGAGRDESEINRFGGMPYSTWAADKPFPAGSENRRFTCPAWWYQSVDFSKKPKWKECLGCGSFSSCEHFPDKAACWSRWDLEFGQAV